MAIEAKASFLDLLKKRLGTEVTAEAMPRILAGVSEVLDGFEMEEHKSGNAETDDMLDQYLSALTIEGRSQKTIDRYSYEIGRLIKWTGVPTGRITIHHIRAYLADEQKRGLMDTSLESHRQIFIAFFNWLQRESLIEKNPTANLGVIKCAKRKKATYSEVKLDKLHQSCQTSRDRAIIAFLEHTGCRISEMTQLNRNDVDLDKLQCIVRGKGNKERKVYLRPVAGMLIREYLAERTDEDPALFIGKFGERLEPGGVRTMLNRVAEAAGVEHVHPHKFRRTLATNMARHGMPVQEVAAILGHEKLDTTMKYVMQNDTDVENDYRRLA